MTNIKFYPLPNGHFVVSYFDEIRRVRIQKTFSEESKAGDYYNSLRFRRPVRDQKRSLRNCTVEELMEVFTEEMPDASLNKSPQLIRDFLDCFSLYRIDQMDELHLRSFYTRQKLEYEYTNHSLSTRKYQLEGFFKWLVKRGIVEESPQALIKMGKSKAYKRKPIHLTPELIRGAIKQAKEQSPGLIYPVLLLVNETACKTSDLMALKWADVDLKLTRIKFAGSEKIRARDLKISGELVDALKRLDQGSDFVFTNLEGRPMQRHQFVKELKRFQRMAGLETDWVFRDLRHSFAVNFMQAGGDTKVLQKVLGHLHPRMTEELYGAFKVHNADLTDVGGVPGTGGFSSENDEFREF